GWRGSHPRNKNHGLAGASHRAPRRGAGVAVARSLSRPVGGGQPAPRRAYAHHGSGGNPPAGNLGAVSASRGAPPADSAHALRRRGRQGTGRQLRRYRALDLPVTTRFSIFALARNALSGQAGWTRQWRSPEPKPAYDAVIVGGGGHGLATAYYLAKEHGLTNIAVLEKGWLGGGNTGRNTTIIRSNYLYDESAQLYEHALKLWEGLSQA